MFKITFVIWVSGFVLLGLSMLIFKWLPRLSHWAFVGFVGSNIIVFVLTLANVFLCFLDLVGFDD